MGKEGANGIKGHIYLHVWIFRDKYGATFPFLLLYPTIQTGSWTAELNTSRKCLKLGQQIRIEHEPRETLPSSFNVSGQRDWEADYLMKIRDGVLLIQEASVP